MFKFNSSEETSKIGNPAQDAVNSAGQTAQHVLDQVTGTGQKVNSAGQTVQHVLDQVTGTDQKVNSAGQTAQQVLDQVTETGQKVIDDTCKMAQDTGEKAMQNVTGQITSWGKSFGESGEKEEVKKNIST